MARRKTKIKPTMNPSPAACPCGRSCFFSGTWTCQAWCVSARPEVIGSLTANEAAAYAIMFSKAVKP